MKATFIQNEPTTAARRAAISRALAMSAATLERLIKEFIANSRPAGRLYRRNAITRRATAQTDRQGLRRARTNQNRAVVGFNFHRASAKGQPPAILSGRLLNSIRARKISDFKYRVASSVVYSIILDNPNGLDRQFFIIVAREFEKEFHARIREAFLIGK